MSEAYEPEVSLRGYAEITAAEQQSQRQLKTLLVEVNRIRNDYQKRLKALCDESQRWNPPPNLPKDSKMHSVVTSIRTRHLAEADVVASACSAVTTDIIPRLDALLQTREQHRSYMQTTRLELEQFLKSECNTAAREKQLALEKSIVKLNTTKEKIQTLQEKDDSKNKTKKSLDKDYETRTATLSKSYVFYTAYYYKAVLAREKFTSDKFSQSLMNFNFNVQKTFSNASAILLNDILEKLQPFSMREHERVANLLGDTGMKDFLTPHTPYCSDIAVWRIHIPDYGLQKPIDVVNSTLPVKNEDVANAWYNELKEKEKVSCEKKMAAQDRMKEKEAELSCMRDDPDPKKHPFGTVVSLLTKVEAERARQQAEAFETFEMMWANLAEIPQQSSSNSGGGTSDPLPTSNTSGFVSTSISPDPRDVPELQYIPYYFGAVPREHCEGYLKLDGDFLLRFGANETALCIAVLQDTPGGVRQARHVKLAYDNNRYHFVRGQGMEFDSVGSLIRYHQTEKIPIRKDAGPGRPVLYIRNAVINEDFKIKNSQIEKLHELGKGAFGTVYLANFTAGQSPTTSLVCVKELTVMDEDSAPPEEKKKFIAEGRLLADLEHENVVRLIGIAATENPVMIVMEYCEGGALQSFLHKCVDDYRPTKHGRAMYNIDEAALLLMARQAAAGMAYLAKKRVIHRDLAARNCLLTGYPGILKLADFGMSRYGDDDEGVYSPRDTKQVPIRWTSPEALGSAQYSSASDVYAYGILLSEIYSFGSMPWRPRGNPEVKKCILRGVILEKPPCMSDEVYTALMVPCLQKAPDDRPTFVEAEEICKKLQEASSSTPDVNGN